MRLRFRLHPQHKIDGKRCGVDAGVGEVGEDGLDCDLLEAGEEFAFDLGAVGVVGACCGGVGGGLGWRGEWRDVGGRASLWRRQGGWERHRERGKRVEG